MRYPLNRVAELADWPEASLRRAVQAPDVAPLMQMRDLGLAVVAARALRLGHSPTCIAALDALAVPNDESWLLSCPERAHVAASPVKAMAVIEDAPTVTWTLTRLSALAGG